MADEPVTLRVTFANVEHQVPISLGLTVADLKAAIQGVTGCPAASQKLMFKGANRALGLCWPVGGVANFPPQVCSGPPTSPSWTRASCATRT